MQAPCVNIFHLKFLLLKALVYESFEHSNAGPIANDAAFVDNKFLNFLMQFFFVADTEHLNLFISEDVIEDNFLVLAEDVGLLLVDLDLDDGFVGDFLQLKLLTEQVINYDNALDGTQHCPV